MKQCSLFLAALLVGLSSTTYADMKMPTADAILAALSGSPLPGFDEFLDTVEELEAAQSLDIEALRRGYRDENGLTESQRNTLYRLLGLYARLKYGDEAMQTLAELVAIPTFEVESLPQNENPEFRRFGAALGHIANDFGLAFRNVDERVYEISLGQPRGELIGLHAHADVVPANPELWVLEDGTRLHFETSSKGACIYYIEERGPTCLEVVEDDRPQIGVGDRRLRAP